MLPLILAGSASSTDRRRPYVIIAGLILSFTIFTLAGGALLSALGLPEDLLRDLAIAAMLVMAASLLSRRVAWLLERPLLFLTRRRPSTDGNGLVLGLSLGLVFVPCAGPVLAAVTVLSASGEVGLRIVLVTGAYAIGAAIPMLAIAIGGQRLTSGSRSCARTPPRPGTAAGVLLGVGALAIAFGLDQKVTTALPAYGTTFQERLEENESVKKELRDLTGSGDALAAGTQVSNGPARPRVPRPEGLAEHARRQAALHRRAAREGRDRRLLDLLLHQLPAHASASEGVGQGIPARGPHDRRRPRAGVRVRTRPLERALGREAPRYPLSGRPRQRLPDVAGVLERLLAGEVPDRQDRPRALHALRRGGYGETESWIRRLLGEKARTRRTSVADETPSDITTPESYLGYARLDRYAAAR